MILRRILGVLALACFVGSAHGADRDLDLSYRPLFLSNVQPQMFAPYLVRLENKGRSTKGVFTVTAGFSSTRYPVDLPQGSRKEITVYMPSTYDQVKGRLTTDIGNAELKFPSNMGSTNCLLSVGDTAGILNFTKALQPRNGMGQSYVPMSALPTELPDRAASYLSFAGVFLADGAEKIGDDARAALERFVLVGGTLVVSGGASSPLINDPRWSYLMPVTGVKPQTLTASPGDLSAGLHLEGDFTMSVGTLSPGAIVKASYRNKPLMVSKPYGFGRVIFVAVNLFEAPVNKWEGKAEFLTFMNLMDSSTKMASLQMMAMVDPMSPSAYMYRGAPPGYASSMPASSDDPFSASAPATATVVWILILYFVLVVPVNLLVLKKLGRGELAWITSPLLSLGFAAVFFQFAAGLYAANLSTASTGFLIANENSKLAYFMGGSQMFFPRGGRYDLGLDKVEGIRGREDDPYGMYGRGGIRRDTSSDFDPIDVGSEVEVKDLSVSNLSFKEFGYYQAAQGEWFSMRTRTDRSVEITNRSGHLLSAASLYFDGGVADAGDIKAGETKLVRLEQTGTPQRDIYNDMGMGLDSMVSGMTRNTKRVVLRGRLEGYRPGPQVGKLVAKNTRLQVFWFGTRGGA